MKNVRIIPAIPKENKKLRVAAYCRVRTGLDKTLRKAEKGKIDYIITKSISRVSRDTLEVLKIIRFLREGNRN